MLKMETSDVIKDDSPPTFQLIRGFPFPKIFNKENIEEIIDYMPQDEDVLIASYPKTGTTWISYIIHQILNKGIPYPSFNDMLIKEIPFMEMAGVGAVEALTTKPRVYKHHLPYHLVQKNPKIKILYVYRKPEDTFISYYHFMNNLGIKSNFNKYFEDFLTGNIAYGRYFEHVLSYLKHKDDDNMLFVSYEKLQKKRGDEILRVAKFLGEEYYKTVVEDEFLLNKIIEHTSFEFMKKNLTYILPADLKNSIEKNSSTDNEPVQTVTFFRKGIIGEGKTCLTENQLHRLREVTKEAMKGTNILLEWLQD